MKILHISFSSCSQAARPTAVGDFGNEMNYDIPARLAIFGLSHFKRILIPGWNSIRRSL